VIIGAKSDAGRRATVIFVCFGKQIILVDFKGLSLSE